ncbi:MAG: DUF559 domain-containing protein [Bacteroidetes bacterium]|nr:DUF559 domain-containing protein [Bacteroidota bacterium]
MRFVPYNMNLKDFSRELRSHSTLSEVLLWKHLKGRQMRGYLFLRQKPLARFIADFYCQKLQLVIEVDGASHNDAEAIGYDIERDAVLKENNLFTLRIKDNDVKTKIDSVLKAIEYYIDDFENKTKTT